MTNHLFFFVLFFTSSAFPLTASHVRINETSDLPHGLYNLFTIPIPIPNPRLNRKHGQCIPANRHAIFVLMKRRLSLVVTC